MSQNLQAALQAVGVGFEQVVKLNYYLVDAPRSTPTRVVLTARAADFGRVVSVSSFEGRRIASIADYPSMEAAESALVQG